MPLHLAPLHPLFAAEAGGVDLRLTTRTWLLWPTKDSPTRYSWIELAQRKDAAKVPKAE